MERIEYRTVDKSAWPRGAWDDEPDKVQWQDEATGLPCLIKRHPSAGHLCGYVGVPEGHPWHGQDCDDVRVSDDEHDWPTVHGGLTYADHCAEGPEAEAICHVPAPSEPDKVWWLGFDCAHCYDLSPGRATIFPAFGDEIYRDIAYVERECRLLAKQAADVRAAIEGVR